MHKVSKPDQMSDDSNSEPRHWSKGDEPGLSSDFILSRQGVWLKKNWTDATFNFCYRGSYPSLLPDYLSKQRVKFAFIDIGANQGLYSLIAAQSKWCAQAMAFEPVLKTFSLLEENIRVNPSACKITAHRCAISDNVGERRISIKIGHSGAASLRKTPSRILRGSETIQTVGPAWLTERRPCHPTIIKIDVEGHEDVVLQTLSEAGYLNTAIAVYYEVNVRWSNAERLRSILDRHGFRFFYRTSSSKRCDVLATREKLTRICG